MATAPLAGSTSRGATALTAAASLACLIYDPRATATEPKTAAALALSIAALALRAGELRRSRRMSGALVLWLAFVGWSGVSALWGRPPGWLELAPWVAACGIALAVSTLERRAAARVVTETALVAGSLSALRALVEFGLGARGILVHGGQGNGNWLGLLLAICLPLSAGRLRSALRDRDRGSAMFAAMVGLQLAALALSESRTAWMAAAAAGGVAALPWLSTGSRKTAVVMLAGVLFSTSLHASANTGGDRLGAIEQASESWRGRLWIWTTTLDIVVQHPATGTGLGDFGHAFLRAQSGRLQALPAPEAARRFENATTAHNDWLQVAAESGLAAPLLLIASLGAAAVAMWRSGRRDAAASAVALAVCGVGDSPLHQPAIVILLALLLGSVGARRSTGLAGLAAGAAALGGAAMLLATAMAQWVASRWETEAKDALPARELVLHERAVRVAPSSGEAWLGLGLARLDRGDCDGALVALDRSSELLANVGTYVAEGNSLLACGRPAQAVSAYERAIALHPGGFRARANIVEALRQLGRFDEARQQWKVAKELYPGHPKLREIGDRLDKSAADAATSQ